MEDLQPEKLEKLNNLISKLAKEFGIVFGVGEPASNCLEFNAKACSVWVAGAIMKLSQLGFIGQQSHEKFASSIADFPGYGLWDEIDELRAYVLSEMHLGLTIGTILKLWANPEDRDEMAGAIAMWYTESGRAVLQKASLEHIYKK